MFLTRVLCKVTLIYITHNEFTYFKEFEVADMFQLDYTEIYFV